MLRHTHQESEVSKSPKATARNTRHRFFLNPYEDAAFTRCPKCEKKTKIRKFPLVIHIDPDQMLLLNKQCKYCEGCDLVIGRKSEIESLMAAAFEDRRPEILGNDYLVLGTMDRQDWRKTTKGETKPTDTLDSIHVFEDVLCFEITGGWQPAEKNSSPG